MNSRAALIVATSTYRDPRLHALAGSEADARELGAVLSDPDIAGFEVS